MAKPLLVIAGPPGGGKTYEAFKAFKRPLAIVSQPGNAHFFLRQVARGRLPNNARPEKLKLIDTFGTGTFNYATEEWDMSPARKTEDNVVLPIGQQDALESMVYTLLQKTRLAKEAGQLLPYESLIIDECGELWQRVHNEAAPSFVSDRTGNQDGRAAYGATGQWHDKLMSWLRALPPLGVGVCLVAHETEPDGKRRGGAKMPSRTIAAHLAAQCDGMIRRLIRRGASDDPATANIIRRYWDVLVSDDRDCKLRGVADEEAHECEDMELLDLCQFAGFKM